MTRMRFITGIVGVVVTIGAWRAGRQRRAIAASIPKNGLKDDPAAEIGRESDRERPRFLPNELLLTFTIPEKVTVGPADVNALIQQVAKELGVPLRPARDAKFVYTPPAPLTVRVSLIGSKADLYQLGVKRAIDDLNIAIRRGAPVTKLSNGIALSSAMPNWIVSNSPAAWLGGPGGLPIAPAPEGVWAFEVPEPLSWASDTPAPDPEVVVAVLDTWPSSAGGPGRLNTAAFAANLSLQRLQSHWSANGAYTSLLPPAELAAVVPPQPGDDFADHGLFVAGIIDSIAPHAKIHVFHVLDDRGFTTTDRILAALDDCLGLFQCRKGTPQRVVINMSIYLLIPPEDLDGGLYAFWTGYPRRQPAGKQAPMTTQQAASVQMLHQEVQKRITLLLEAGAVIVAAAGNDAITLGKGRHLQPRLPADYPELICAVATSGSGALARYTNAPNPPNEGPGVSIATFGGQAYETTLPSGTLVLGQPLPQATAVVQSDQRDAVVGLCTLPTVNTPGDNKTGWIYWAGTSFATPILSGVAANVLARNPKLNPCALGKNAHVVPLEVQREILKATTTTTTVGCPYLAVKQYRTS
jgi:subtilase family protein